MTGRRAGCDLTGREGRIFDLWLKASAIAGGLYDRGLYRRTINAFDRCNCLYTALQLTRAAIKIHGGRVS